MYVAFLSYGNPREDTVEKGRASRQNDRRSMVNTMELIGGLLQIREHAQPYENLLRPVNVTGHKLVGQL